MCVQVSWIRRRDWHIMSHGDVTYTSDDRHGDHKLASRYDRAHKYWKYDDPTLQTIDILNSPTGISFGRLLTHEEHGCLHFKYLMTTHTLDTTTFGYGHQGQRARKVEINWPSKNYIWVVEYQDSWRARQIESQTTIERMILIWAAEYHDSWRVKQGRMAVNEPLQKILYW